MKVVTAQMMRELDRRTIEEIGVKGLVLMENAGLGTAEAIDENFPGVQFARVVVIAGRGNNGGDGYVVARHLSSWGAEVLVVLLCRKQEVQGDAAVNLEILGRLGVEVVEAPDESALDGQADQILGADIVVDAVFGTGLRRKVEGLYARAIDLINGFPGPVVSVDIPSGLNADTGQPMGDAVFADLTVTFGLPKLGHILYPGAIHCGSLELVDIGIPSGVVDEADIPYSLVERGQIQANFLPRKPDAHKGSFGHLLVLAGSPGFTGAAIMTGQAAARVGAGLVTVGCPAGVNPILEAHLTEVITRPLPESAAGTFSKKAATQVMDLLKNKSALALGPGITTDPEVRQLVARLVEKADVPLVLDADGLNCLEGKLALLRKRKADTVLTPHPGEMARLVRSTAEKVNRDRVGVARKFAERHGVHVVLKGAGTVTACPDGQVFINTTGNPGMASGGTGDVLTGMIAGFMAQGMPAREAALTGVFLHGLAGDEAALRVGERALLAGDILEELPAVIRGFEQGLDEEDEQ